MICKDILLITKLALLHTVKLFRILLCNNPHVVQIKEPAWYVQTQVGITAGADMMFNDTKSAMKAGHHWGAPTSTWNVLLDCITNNSIKHQSFVNTELNLQTVLFQTIQFSIHYLFVHSLYVKQFYLTHR